MNVAGARIHAIVHLFVLPQYVHQLLPLPSSWMKDILSTANSTILCLLQPTGDWCAGINREVSFNAPRLVPRNDALKESYFGVNMLWHNY
jgi:hypothetical protein